MQKSIASILCVLSFVAFAAPTVSYQTATNIAKKVVEQTLSDALAAKRDHGDFEVANGEKAVKFGEWKFTGSDVQPGAVYSLRLTEAELMDQWDLLEDGNLIDIAVYDKSVSKSVTEISPADWFDHSEITATRPIFVYVDGPDTLVGAKYVDGKVSAAVSTNNPAFVSAVQNTPAPEPGQGEDPPWGTWGTVGAAIAGLVAGLKWLKDKVFDSAGNIQDQFATDLLGKQVANAKVRYSLATESSATMADRTVNIYTLSSGTVQMIFPTATTHDGTTYARDFLLKLTYSGGTLQMPQGVTKVGDELSFEAGKTYLIAFTEIAADKFYVRSIDITEAQA